ncbi:uncharacterized protein LOC122650732 [Telopea speciosissima]|uniref:uncharacterized protein LOC122650732 n=1 Tax=Telopea speciosissima TaxID=54955 RepID=UPI001CC80793|nr:uncharacterized protein LOC122650732 [Telopea speciosissima]
MSIVGDPHSSTLTQSQLEDLNTSHKAVYTPQPDSKALPVVVEKDQSKVPFVAVQRSKTMQEKRDGAETSRHGARRNKKRGQELALVDELVIQNQGGGAAGRRLTRIQCPWMLIGDFNSYLFSHEKRGPIRYNVGSSEEFVAMMDSTSLMSIPSSGCKFTWSNIRCVGNVRAVLDRSICNEEWFLKFPGSAQWVLPRGYSDHSPIVISCFDVPHLVNVPFHIQQFWAEHSEFCDVVRESWNSPVTGTPISCVQEIQGRIELEGFNETLFDLELAAKGEFDKAIAMQEKLWTERSRDRWV